MRTVTICWGPECGATIEQSGVGRTQRYHAPSCKTRAARRNGGKAPTEPYPPLEAGEPFQARGYGKLSARLTQDAAAPTVASDAPRPGRGNQPPAAKVTTGPRGGPVPDDRNQARKGSGPAAPEAESEPAPATVTQLHLAITEDATVPVEIKVHPMVAAYRTDLDRMGMTQTRKGQQVLTMAEKLVSSATSPAAAANLSRELERLMDALVQASPENQVLQDPSVAIRERTIAKLRAVQGGLSSERAG